MVAYVITGVGLALALIAAYLRLIARSEQLRKERAKLSPGEEYGEEAQDKAAGFAFLGAAVAALGFANLPFPGVESWAHVLANVIFGAGVIAALFHLTALMTAFGNVKRTKKDTGAPEPAQEPSKAVCCPCCKGTCGQQTALVPEGKAS